MRHERMAHYVGLDARTTAELGELLTAKCKELRGKSPEVIWNLQNGNSALLLYYEETLIPETLADRYELRGEVYYCADCPFKEPVTDGRKRYRYTCERKIPGVNPEDRACNWFYTALEQGEI